MGVLKFSNQAIFLLMTPTSMIYIVAIELSWRSSIRKPFEGITIKDESHTDHDHIEPLLVDHDHIDPIEEPPESMHFAEREICGVEKEESHWQQIKRCFIKTWYRNVTLFFVYIFE